MLKQFIQLVEWYRWVLKFNLLKYIGIFIMITGPLVSIYRYIFLNTNIYELMFVSLGFLLLGSFVWSFGWDPYA